MPTINRRFLSTLFVIAIAFGIATAQTTQFTYQGRLLDGSLPANAAYDLEFALFDAGSGGTQLGTTQTVLGVPVRDGVFTVQLDFGAEFPGAGRFLEIAVRASGGGSYTPLTPRQPISSAPYAVRSLNSLGADSLSANCVGCVASGHIGSVDGSVVSGEIPVAGVPSGSANYVQNQNAGPQGTANFNIDGTGTANIFDAATQYNIGGDRLLSIRSNNLFAGVHAGLANPIGGGNSFFGFDAGRSNTSGGGNSFFGTAAGRATTTSSNNSFFGSLAGFSNVAGGNNSFFGTSAGQNNTASGNSFFGSRAGSGNTIGGTNSFFGLIAGQINTTGSDNTMIGFNANPVSASLNFATAIGSGSTVDTSNTIALGRSSGADVVVVYGLGAPGSVHLCRNASNQISTCTSGAVEDVKDRQFTTVLTNSVNELKKENDSLKMEIETQRTQISALRQALCRLAPTDDICAEEPK